MSILNIFFISFMTIFFLFSLAHFTDFNFISGQEQQITKENPTKYLNYSVGTDYDVFVTLRGSDALISLDRNQSWPTGPDTTYIDATSDGKKIIASSGDNHLYVYANEEDFEKNGTNAKLIAKINVGEKPKGVKISPDEKYAVVANEGTGTISIIDFKNLTVIKEIVVGSVPHNIVFSPISDKNDQKLAYVTIQGEDKITILDMNTLDKVGEISVGNGPHNLDITPDGKVIYVVNAGSNDVAVIDIASKHIIKKIPVSTGHHGIDVSPDGKRVYVSGIGSDKVNVIDPIKLTLLEQINVGNGPHGLRTSPDGKVLYVGVTSLNKIALIDTEQLKIIGYIKTGKIPFWIAVSNN